MSYQNVDIEEEIATRMYELDTEAYENSRSSMGQLFPGTRSASIKKLVKNLKENKQKIMIRNLVLIGNMIRTVDERSVREELDKEFRAVSDMFYEYVSEDHSPEFWMDAYSLKHRYDTGKNEHRIICIGREFGGGGDEVGQKIAHALGYSFYDRELFEMAQEGLGEGMDSLDGRVSSEKLSERLSGARRKFSFFGISSSDALYFKQSERIVEIARREDAVFLGRCADAILEAQDIPSISIFVGAPKAARIKRIMDIKSLSENEASLMVERMDKQRRDYYNYYTNKLWGHAGNYDFCVNSACYGIDGTVDVILKMLDYSGVDMGTIKE